MNKTKDSWFWRGLEVHFLLSEAVGATVILSIFWKNKVFAHPAPLQKVFLNLSSFA